jgi:hypothetical protein
MTRKYDEFLLEHRLYKNGKFTGYGSIKARTLQQILAVKEELEIDNHFSIRAWSEKKSHWETLIEKNLVIVEMQVKDPWATIEEEEEALEMAY